MHLLQFIDSQAYRRMIGAQLNIGESRHALARRIFFGRLGELRHGYREGMEDQIGALGMALNAVVWWNTLYIDVAMNRLQGQALADLLAQETVKVSGRSKITVADLDVGLGWSLYEAVSHARSDAVTHAIATPNTPWGSDSQTLSYESWITARGEHRLGRVQYEVCEPCGAGRLNKISFSAEWRFCGLGTLALRQLEMRHPGLVWYTTTQYAKGFFDRYRLGSDSSYGLSARICEGSLPRASYCVARSALSSMLWCCSTPATWTPP